MEKLPEMYRPVRMQAAGSSIIPVIADKIARHPGTISLGQGVVHYGPPETVEEKIALFLSDPKNHKYGPTQGIAPLIEAIAAKLANQNGIAIQDRRQIVVTTGSNMAFHLAVLAITDPGDEIILPTPYFFNHEMTVSLASCRTVCVPTLPSNHLDVAAMQAAITNRTRAIVTVSPNNPTGAVYGEEELRAIHSMCRERGIFHISDEAYEDFVYDGVAHTSPGAFPESARHSISLFTLSKAYGFAGWRMGYMVIPEALIDDVYKAQDTLTICPPIINQFAALAALEAGPSYANRHLIEIAETRGKVLQQLHALVPACTVTPAAGAFYFFIKVRTNKSAYYLAEKLIEEHGVAVIPGEAFGVTEGCYLRVAYAALPQPLVLEGVRRLVHGLKSLLATGD